MTEKNVATATQLASGNLPEGEQLQKFINQRRIVGKIWQGIMFASTIIGLFVLIVLLYTIVDETFGLAAVQRKTDIATRGPLEELPREELLAILDAHPSGALRAIAREQPFTERDDDDLREIIDTVIMGKEVVASWPLHQALFDRASIEAEIAEDENLAGAELEWKSWLSSDFLTSPMNSNPAVAGVRTALLGSIWLMLITLVVSLPLGVGAAIYLEEYATDTHNPILRRINEIIQTNINNLAGVPSIIYGMLGLAIFARAFETLTQGRTIVSAGLTMALLILPVIIINAQEAIRAVPRSLRQASYGLGATKWQTIWNHVLPNSVAGIMTGTILAMSRAVGETAPLIVVGASTFILTDPDSPFARFTALPILIYNWTSRPSDLFRDIAAAGILVLLVLLLSMNAIAIVLRNRYSRSL